MKFPFFREKNSILEAFSISISIPIWPDRNKYGRKAIGRALGLILACTETNVDFWDQCILNNCLLFAKVSLEIHLVP
jgi:hypothetical protein